MRQRHRPAQDADSTSVLAQLGARVREGRGSATAVSRFDGLAGGEGGSAGVPLGFTSLGTVAFVATALLFAAMAATFLLEDTTAPREPLTGNKILPPVVPPPPGVVTVSLMTAAAAAAAAAGGGGGGGGGGGRLSGCARAASQFAMGRCGHGIDAWCRRVADGNASADVLFFDPTCDTGRLPRKRKGQFFAAYNSEHPGGGNDGGGGGGGGGGGSSSSSLDGGVATGRASGMHDPAWVGRMDLTFDWRRRVADVWVPWAPCRKGLVGVDLRALHYVPPKAAAAAAAAVAVGRGGRGGLAAVVGSAAAGLAAAAAAAVGSVGGAGGAGGGAGSGAAGKVGGGAAAAAGAAVSAVEYAPWQQALLRRPRASPLLVGERRADVASFVSSCAEGGERYELLQALEAPADADADANADATADAGDTPPPPLLAVDHFGACLRNALVREKRAALEDAEAAEPRPELLEEVDGSTRFSFGGNGGGGGGGGAQELMEPAARAKIRVLSLYKFALVFERSRDADHVTEQLWHALAAGTLPVYWGPAATARAWVPCEGCVVWADDFPSAAALAAHLRGMPDATYLAHFAWKRRGGHRPPAGPAWAQSDGGGGGEEGNDGTRRARRAARLRMRPRGAGFDKDGSSFFERLDGYCRDNFGLQQGCMACERVAAYHEVLRRRAAAGEVVGRDVVANPLRRSPVKTHDRYNFGLHAN